MVCDSLATFEPAGELFAHDRVCCLVELSPEPRCGLLADLAHARVERGRGDLGVAFDLALRHALEALGLPALELDQRQLEPGSRVRLCLLDALGDGGLARTEPLGDLLDRASTLDASGLRARRAPRRRLRRLPARAPLGAGGRPVVARRSSSRARPRRARYAPRRPAMACCCLWVSVASCASMCRCERSRSSATPCSRSSRRRSTSESVSASASPARRSRSTNVAAPLLGDAALLGRQLRDRVGALACERPPDLLGVRCGLLCDGRRHLRPCVGDERRRRGRASARPAQREPQDEREPERSGQAGGENPEVTPERYRRRVTSAAAIRIVATVRRRAHPPAAPRGRPG